MHNSSFSFQPDNGAVLGLDERGFEGDDDLRSFSSLFVDLRRVFFLLSDLSRSVLEVSEHSFLICSSTSPRAAPHLQFIKLSFEKLD